MNIKWYKEVKSFKQKVITDKKELLYKLQYSYIFYLLANQNLQNDEDVISVILKDKKTDIKKHKKLILLSLLKRKKEVA